jgi:hypothetical protein
MEGKRIRKNEDAMVKSRALESTENVSFVATQLVHFQLPSSGSISPRSCCGGFHWWSGSCQGEKRCDPAQTSWPHFKVVCYCVAGLTRPWRICAVIASGAIFFICMTPIC